MDGLQAINELNELTLTLSRKIDLLRDYGIKMANAKHAYNVELGKEIMRLRGEGTPATLVEKLAKAKIAKVILDMDLAEVMHDTQKEDIMATKLKIRVLQEQINREWGQIQ